MIILIRHAQSEGNKNREIHQSIPDHRVKLTPEGHKQATEAGRKLRGLLRPDDTLHFFTSPYRRTRETTEGILQSLTSDDPSPSPFPRHTIKVYEEPRLREQDFGNFQPCSAEMERMWQERSDYGHFFYRIPNGESAADAYDRVSGFNETLWRLFGEDSFPSVCVLVTHGLMTRVFLMRWYHFSVEYFEDLRNVNHCEFVIMEKNRDNGKYVLQNKLRTWSALRKDKELEMERERVAKKLLEPLPESPVPERRKWGGCPEGCHHGGAKSRTWRPARQDKVDLFRDDDGGETSDGRHRGSSGERGNHANSNKETAKVAGSTKQKTNLSIDSRQPDVGEMISSPDQTPSYISIAALSAPRTASPPTVGVTGTDDDSSTRPTTTRRAREPPFSISPLRLNDDGSSDDPRERPLQTLPVRSGPKQLDLPRLAGRDGGGSASGVNSVAPSSDEEVDGILPESKSSLPKPQPPTGQDAEDDGDDEGAGSRRSIRRPKQHHHQIHHRVPAGGSTQPLPHRRANALGDADSASDDETEDFHPADAEEADDDDDSPSKDETDRLRAEEQSVQASVY
jgi:broad specificity phosphatase PhoE